ncbi:ATPase domain-containing protein [Infirmifilum lucidum]|nr:ATPase domain-containing protein [Infirmifilum lucidum]
MASSVRKPGTCLNCPLYIASRSYCLKLKTAVQDPYNPPCRFGEPIAYQAPVPNTVTQHAPQQAVAGTPVAQPVYPQAPPQQSAEGEPYYDPAMYAEDVSLSSHGLMTQRLDLLAPTGVPGLDEILAGGFLRGKTYLVAGEAGCGKTIFSIQFLIHGALRGEPGLYIAIDEPTNQLLRGLKLFGWDLGDLVSSRKLMFLDMRTHFSKIYMREERKHIEPRYIIEQILNAAKRISAKRLVIDPIAPLVYGGREEDVLYAREFLREMVFAIEKTGELTTIMTSEIPTGSTKLSRFGVEEFLASGIIVLGIEEIYGNVERVMYIRKARWAPVKPSKYIFDIVSGKGIVIREPLSEYIKRISRGTK